MWRGGGGEGVVWIWIAPEFLSTKKEKRETVRVRSGWLKKKAKKAKNDDDDDDDVFWKE